MTGSALTPAQLKLLQKNLPSGSPYGKGKSPFKGTGKGKGLARTPVNEVNNHA